MVARGYWQVWLADASVWFEIFMFICPYQTRGL